MFEPFSVSTPAGDVSLVPPTRAVIEKVYRALPFGLRQTHVPQEGAWFGLIMKKGDVEVEFTKLQPPDVEVAVGAKLEHVNALVLAHAMVALRERPLPGLLLPCTYRRDKGGARSETSIALHAAEALLVPFVRAFEDAAKKQEVPAGPYIGVERRKRLELGSIAFSFLTIDGELVSLRRTVHPADPVWTILASAGVRELPHMPALPLEMP
jgi:hypothetical protein